MIKKFKRECKEFALLLKEVPSFIIILFVMALFSMNLLANKSMDLPFSWLALDCGTIISWFAFLAMDVLTKHFGPKASTQISLFATAINLLFCLFLFIGSSIPGTWGESYVEGSEKVINNAINNTFSGTWYVILGSTFAFIISSVVNNFSNWGIGNIFKKNPDGKSAFFLRAYISTSISQFVDNLTFAFVVSHFFFGWTLVQCFTCAFTGMVFELLFEVVFSGCGYSICKKWKEKGVGKEYFEYINSQGEDGN